jgi:hypothetical protein
VTLAPATTPPDWSLTVPRRDALVWAHVACARAANATRTKTAKINPRTGLTNPPPWLRTHAQIRADRQAAGAAEQEDSVRLRIASKQMPRFRFSRHNPGAESI